MGDRPTSLAAALAAFQASLPAVKKTKTAKVATKTGGSYSYGYAGLPEVSGTVLPLLGALGLSFSASPTLRDGRFVLAYRLAHECGDSMEGEYPLPQQGTPQEIGSAITYARRYSLCSVVGVAAEEDDDGAAASSTKTNAAQRHWDAADQEALFDGWSADIDKAQSTEDLSAIGGTLKAMTKRGELSPVAYDRLVQLGAARRAELNGAAIGERTRARLFALFGELGMGGDEHRQARRDMGTQVLRRTVESMRTLTEVEGRQMVAALEARKKGATS